MRILEDLLVRSRKVTVAGKELEVFGLTFEEIGKLVARFDTLRLQLLAAVKTGEVSAVALVSKAGTEAMCAVIAAGLGKIADAETEADAAKLSGGVQIDLLDQIVQHSLPSGDGPLARQLAGAVKLLTNTAMALLPGLPPTSSAETPLQN